MTQKQKLELTWVGKEKRPKLEPRILLEDPEKSYHAKFRNPPLPLGEGQGVREDIFDNRLIFGDNLLALKALEQEFSGKVKCVFIDPPYNTGSAFTHYDDGLEHSIWLGLMRDRLEIIRRLLSEDGSLWMTIDDNEVHYLKVTCDEIFGRINFVSNVVWQKKYTVSNDAKWLAETHDHVLVYAKNKEIWRPNRLERTAEMDSRYRNPDNHPKGPWKATPLYAKRTGSEKEQAFTFKFKNGIVWAPPRGTSPRFPAEALRQMDDNDEIWFGSDGTANPSRKTFLSELKPVINPHYNAAMLAEALAKLEGFTYAPSETLWWQHSYSSERDFIYVTTQNLSATQLQALADEVGGERSLLVCCSAFHGISAAAASERWPNLTLKKIPKMVLARCKWGHDDYSLNVANLPMAQETKSDPGVIAVTSEPRKRRTAAVADSGQGDLFGGDA